MHIPDGYLSPSTCATFWAGSLPFWSVALRRVRAATSGRAIPLVSLAAAFSFVIMLFNIPLPGGTTGHATGVAIAAIVLGPWCSMAAISVALLIQALLFGDGGITSFGANAFNMAIVGSLAAWATWRLVAGHARVDSGRRVIAAGIAGYAAINTAAFCAAIELGIQPMLFHDAIGTPLYAPYSIAIAVPAMMIGHLTIAGLAEALLTAGVVAWAQRADPRLLETNVHEGETATEIGVQPRSLRPLWTAVAILMVLAPLGLLAVGAAWGEWSAGDFTDPTVREKIVAASSNAPLPATTPRGLARLSTIWSAPLPDYAPPFLRSAALGYLLSATFGIGLILLVMVPLARSRRS